MNPETPEGRREADAFGIVLPSSISPGEQASIRHHAEKQRRKREREQRQLDDHKTWIGNFDPDHQLDPEKRQARREDNKTMAKSREIHRGAKKHGQRTKPKGNSGKPWIKDAKVKAKAKRLAK